MEKSIEDSRFDGSSIGRNRRGDFLSDDDRT